MDNITVVIVCFKNFRKQLKKELDFVTKEAAVDVQDEGESSIDDKGIPLTATQLTQSLNLPNYDLNFEDISVLPKQLDIQALQNVITEKTPNKVLRPLITEHYQTAQQKITGSAFSPRQQQSQGKLVS